MVFTAYIGVTQFNWLVFLKVHCPKTNKIVGFMYTHVLHTSE